MKTIIAILIVLFATAAASQVQVQTVAPPGLCLDYGVGAYGTPVILQACSGSPSQMWYYNPTTAFLQIGSDRKCAMAGTPVTINVCWEGQYGHWSFTNGQLMFGYQCMVADNTKTPPQATLGNCSEGWTMPPEPPPQLGIFGPLPTTIAAFDEWLGRRADYVLVFGGYANGWNDFTGSIWYQSDLWMGSGQKLLWTAPLIPFQWNAPPPPLATLEQAATGAYDDYYAAVAYTIATYDPAAVIRIGVEFNDAGHPWSAAADPAAYIGAFQDYVKVFREASPSFKFMWCPDIGATEMDPELAYPGDDFVDIIGMDVYEDSRVDLGPPHQRWQNFLTLQGRGLSWLATFAAVHNKPIAIPEWATNYDDGSFIWHMHDWMVAHNVVMQSYWDSSSNFDGDFATHIANGIRYRKLFGGTLGAPP